ncbi:lycopene cyclase family protein [Nocardia sp. NPDC004260]
MRAGLFVTAIDPKPERLWSPTYACWIDELPKWLPSSVIAARMETMTAWTSTEHRIARPYCVLSKPGLRDALPLDDATVIAGRATRVDAHEVELADGRIVRAAVVFDARGLPPVRQRRAVSAHGIFVSAETAAPMLSDGGGLLLDWRPGNGAGPDEPPSFLYAVPVGDGTVVFEETSLGLRGGMPQRELRKRLRTRLAANGIRVTGAEPSEAPHYPLDQPPPKNGMGRVIPFGSCGGMMHPTTSYSVGDALALVDTAVDAVCDERDPVAELWLAGSAGLLDADARAVGPGPAHHRPVDRDVRVLPSSLAARTARVAVRARRLRRARRRAVQHGRACASVPLAL